MLPGLDQFPHDVGTRLVERPPRLHAHQLIGVRLDIGCDHPNLAELLRRDVFELTLHGSALDVLLAQAECRQRWRIDLSMAIDAWHRPALTFDGIQHRRRPVRPIVLPDTRDEGAAQIIVTDADCHYRAPLALGQDGPVGFDPLAVAPIGARFRVAQDAARFLDQRPPGGLGLALGFDPLRHCVGGLALFGFTLPVETMTLAQGLAKILMPQTFDDLPSRRWQGGQIEKEPVVFLPIGCRFCREDKAPCMLHCVSSVSFAWVAEGNPAAALRQLEQAQDLDEDAEPLVFGPFAMDAILKSKSGDTLRKTATTLVVDRPRSGELGYTARYQAHLWLNDRGDDIAHYRHYQWDAIVSFHRAKRGTLPEVLRDTSRVPSEVLAALGRTHGVSPDDRGMGHNQPPSTRMTDDIAAARGAQNVGMMISPLSTDPMREMQSLRPAEKKDKVKAKTRKR